MVKCYDDDCLKAMCLPVSRDLKKFLISKGFNTAIVVQGKFRVDNPDPQAVSEMDMEDFESPEEFENESYTPLHYWVEIKELGELIIDITASQFNDELDDPVSPIEIGTYEELERYTPIHKDWIGAKNN